MINELSVFDSFVDDLIDSEDNLLNGELDFLLMQTMFDSLELENLKELNIQSKDYKAA